MQKYYVLSQGEGPVRVFFDEDSAKIIGATYSNAYPDLCLYLDVFDSNGFKRQTLKLVRRGSNPGNPVEWSA